MREEGRKNARGNGEGNGVVRIIVVEHGDKHPLPQSKRLHCLPHIVLEILRLVQHPRPLLHRHMPLKPDLTHDDLGDELAEGERGGEGDGYVDDAADGALRVGEREFVRSKGFGGFAGEPDSAGGGPGVAEDVEGLV